MFRMENLQPILLVFPHVLEQIGIPKLSTLSVFVYPHIQLLGWWIDMNLITHGTVYFIYFTITVRHHLQDIK